jgi:hypothetical protein
VPTAFAQVQWCTGLPNPLTDQTGSKNGRGQCLWQLFRNPLRPLACEYAVRYRARRSRTTFGGDPGRQRGRLRLDSSCRVPLQRNVSTSREGATLFLRCRLLASGAMQLVSQRLVVTEASSTSRLRVWSTGGWVGSLPPSAADMRSRAIGPPQGLRSRARRSRDSNPRWLGGTCPL